MENTRSMITNIEKFWIKLNGQSMYPLLHDQDEILIAQVERDELELGDIVLFKDQGSKELTVHRFIEKPFITKGDYSLASESNPQETLLGVAVAYKRSDVVRNLSGFKKIFVFFSKLRMSNYLMRKIGLLGLFILTILLGFYNAISKLDHTKLLH